MWKLISQLKFGSKSNGPWTTAVKRLRCAEFVPTRASEKCHVQTSSWMDIQGICWNLCFGPFEWYLQCLTSRSNKNRVNSASPPVGIVALVLGGTSDRPNNHVGTGGFLTKKELWKYQPKISKIKTINFHISKLIHFQIWNMNPKSDQNYQLSVCSTLPAASQAEALILICQQMYFN